MSRLSVSEWPLCPPCGLIDVSSQEKSSVSEKLRNPITVASESEFLKTLDVIQNNSHETLHILDNVQKYRHSKFLGIKYQNANNGHIITKICKLES